MILTILFGFVFVFFVFLFVYQMDKFATMCFTTENPEQQQNVSFPVKVLSTSGAFAAFAESGNREAVNRMTFVKISDDSNGFFRMRISHHPEFWIELSVPREVFIEHLVDTEPEVDDKAVFEEPDTEEYDDELVEAANEANETQTQKDLLN